MQDVDHDLVSCCSIRICEGEALKILAENVFDGQNVILQALLLHNSIEAVLHGRWLVKQDLADKMVGSRIAEVVLGHLVGTIFPEVKGSKRCKNTHKTVQTITNQQVKFQQNHMAG